MSVMSWRRSPLAERHRALGSNLEDWNGMETAWTYTASNRGISIEPAPKRPSWMFRACARSIWSGHIRITSCSAPPRDAAKPSGKSVYACMLNETGKFTDDCILYRTGPNSWMVVVGSGTGYEELTRDILGKNAAILFDDDLQDLSLQGPLAVDYLSKHVPDIRERKISTPHSDDAVRQACDDLTQLATRASAATRSSARLRTRRRSGTRSCRKARRWASSLLRSQRSTGSGWRAICCSTLTIIRRCIRSRTSSPAIRCGNWVLISRFRPARRAFGAPRSITASRARNVSRFSVYSPIRTRSSMPATNFSLPAKGSAWSHARCIPA